MAYIALEGRRRLSVVEPARQTALKASRMIHTLRGGSVTLRAGVAACYAVAVLCAIYLTVLAVGLLTLPSADHPIQNPWFTLMEVLILAIAPGMVAVMVALHAWVPVDRKVFALLGIAFMSMCAAVTCGVHFAILTLSHQPLFVTADWSAAVLAFRWPSVVYALDILAWDLFYALAALCGALSIKGPGLPDVARGLLFISALLALVGLAGVPLADMNIRNIGIIGYVVLFPTAAIVLAILFQRTGPHSVS